MGTFATNKAGRHAVLLGPQRPTLLRL